MPQQLDSLSPENLTLSAPVPLTLHPAGVYLSGLSEGSRRTIRYSLNTIASLLTDGECDALTLDWSQTFCSDLLDEMRGYRDGAEVGGSRFSNHYG